MIPPAIRTEHLFDIADGGWVGFSDGFPACSRSGSTEAEARRETADAIVASLERVQQRGLPLPLTQGRRRAG